MVQGQCVEAKKSGCRQASVSARHQSRSGLGATNMYSGNRHFWVSYDIRSEPKALRQPDKGKGSIKRAFGPTFVIII